MRVIDVIPLILTFSHWGRRDFSDTIQKTVNYSEVDLSESPLYTVASVGALIGADICDSFSGMASFLYTCTRYER